MAGPGPRAYHAQMATTQQETLVPADIFEPLELLVFGAIGMTTLALAESSGRELTFSGWRTLVVLGHAEKTRVGSIAQAIGMSLPSASRLIRRLERDGLVVTERDETDRRATLVSLTPRGHELRDAVVDRRRVLMTEALQARSPKIPKGLIPGLDAIARAFAPYT
jgi:DNA-binding MarR family transcriptional regulator